MTGTPPRHRRRGGAAGIRSNAVSGRPRRQRRPSRLPAPRAPAADGRPSARSRRARGTPAHRRPRSSTPWQSARVGLAAHAGPPIRRCHQQNPAVARAPRRHANPASNRRRTSAGRRTNGPIGTVGSTASNHSNHTAPTGPTGTARSTAPTTRSRGCGTGAPTKATSVRSIGQRRARPGTEPTPGSTTPRPRRAGPTRSRGTQKCPKSTEMGHFCVCSRGRKRRRRLALVAGWTDLAGQGEDQRLVGGRDRLHHVETMLGQPLQHAAHQDLRHRCA